MSSDACAGYLKGNVMKYLWRYQLKKNPVEDLKKAKWYLEKLIEVTKKSDNMNDRVLYGLIVVDTNSVKPTVTCSKCDRLIDKTDNYCRYCGIKFLGTRVITSGINRD